MTTTPPNDNFSTPVAEVEDPDDWEYEYSTTETETFYVTLDLTTPEVPAIQRQTGRRAATTPRWTNPGLGKHQRMARLPEESGFKIATVLSIDDSELAEKANAEQEEEVEMQDEDEIDGRQRKKRKKKENPPPEEEPRATEVQILDLHSIKPLVSYDGHVFACRWSENIGTEMLFVPREKENKLPVLRELPGCEVDLLAASSARITARTAHLERKFEAESKGSVAGRGKGRPKARGGGAVGGVKSNASIPRGTSSQRNTQAQFLEQLIDLKEDIGEEDFVTVYAKARLTNFRWRKEMHALRAAERERLELVIADGRNAAAVAQARERLEQMDEEDEDLRKVEEEKGIAAGANNTTKRKRQGGRPKKNPVTPLEVANKGHDHRHLTDQSSNGLDGRMEQMGTPFTESTDGNTPPSFGAEMDDDPGVYGTLGEVRFQDDGLSDQDAEGDEDDDMYEY
ncbi:hypothetical protein BKA64DRAFT_702745 [Cadophora sp. MPI-SDFR-AT-0126]|nr:hypothetical protein BKA64DRAFT_702745 [Leotiomycetes sp. MPI-SDFR-AT-0126]